MTQSCYIRLIKFIKYLNYNYGSSKTAQALLKNNTDKELYGWCVNRLIRLMKTKKQSVCKEESNLSFLFNMGLVKNE